MSSTREPSLFVQVAVTLMGLLGLYVGAYYAMVTPLPLRFGGVLVEILPYYNGQSLERFFEPMHQLDRRIRSHVWEPSE